MKVADIPNGTSLVFCRSGNGNVYLWDNTAKSLSKIDTNGSSTGIFDESSCIDAGFTIAEFNAGALSPDERYFYFSAKIKETGQDYTLELYRLCRFDLQSKELTPLNRTEYSLVRSRRTLQAAQPFEGNIYFTS